LIFAAFKNALRKRYWITITVMLWQIGFLVWKKGISSYLEIVQLMAISALASIVVISIIGVPLEYNRLKRRAAGLHVPDYE